MYHSSINLLIRRGSSKTFNYWLLYLLGLFSTLNAQQLTEPLVCQNPNKELGNNYYNGGAFDINKYSCISDVSPVATHVATSPTGVEPNSVQYFFNYKDDSNLLQLSTNNSQSFTMPGKYWVLQQGNKGNQKLIACNTFEVIQTYQPDIEINQCGNTNFAITFPNTLKNKTHSQYTINWGDGTTETFTMTQLPFTTPYHSYTQTPLPKIRIIADYRRNGSTICSVPPLTTTIAAINNNTRISSLVSSKNGTTVQLIAENLIANTLYVIQYRKFNQTNWTEIPSTAAQLSSSFSIDNLQPNTTYVFRIKSQPNTCPNTSYSNEVSTLLINIGSENATSTNISWSVVQPNNLSNQNYTLKINDSNNNQYNSINTQATLYQFHIPDCTKKYYFQLTASYTNNNQTVTIQSAEALFDPQFFNGKLKPIIAADIQYENNAININLTQPNTTVAQYLFYRTDSDNPIPKLIATKLEPILKDTNSQPNQKQYCYQVQYIDFCGLKSQLSGTFCNILLTQNNEYILRWNQINPSISEANYSLEVPNDINFQETLNNRTAIDYRTLPNINTLLLTQESTEVQITGQQKIANPDTTSIIVYAKSNPITINLPPTLFIPNTFTPNNDGPLDNETFKVKSPFELQLSMNIFNQWGEIIFSCNDINQSWDGTFQGKPCPEGQYVYKITAHNKFNQSITKQGTINLLR